MTLPDPEYDPQFYDGVASKRLVAWGIDAVVIFFIFIFLMLVLGALTFGIAGYFFIPILMLSSIGYRTVTIASFSATPGMKFMGIEFRGHDGQCFTTVQAAVHSAVFSLLMTSVIGLIISIVCILKTKLGQGLPDLLLGSTAINRPVD